MSAPDEKLLNSIPAKGMDIPFLMDAVDGPRVVYVNEITEKMIEPDAFYDDVPRIETARLYLLRHGAVPSPCTHKSESYAQDVTWIYKVFKVYVQTGELVAQHTYVVPNYKYPTVGAA